MPFHFVDFGSKRIKFKIQFSERKTLGISVLPDMSVVVTAPSSAVNDIDKIRAKIIKRAPWILRQQMRFATYLPKQPARRYVSGESYRYLGRQIRLKIIKDKPEKVRLKDGYLEVTIQDRDDKSRIEKNVQNWYQERAKIFFEKKVDELTEKFSRYDIGKPKFKLRRMTMRWGSCGRSSLIYLNPDLIKAPSSCVEYVIVHELCHLIHRNHDKQFYKLLLKVMPDWELRKARLERSQSY